MEKINPENLTKKITKILEEYEEEIEDIVVETTDSIIKEAKNELVTKSPKGATGEYSKGWTIHIKEKGNCFYSKAIWNKKFYRLTHLLEFGHATKNGGHTNPQPHIRPVEEKYTIKFIEDIERKTKR